MSFNLNFKSLLSILALSSTFGFAGNPTIAQTKVAQNSFKTTFHCISTQGNVLYTVARRGNRQTEPILKWQNKGWGSQYTPKKRCDIVSGRLTRAVEKNNGKLGGLLMWYGKLNGYPILCYLRSKRERCNSSNILLTLRKSEFGQERKIIDDIMTFGVGARGNTTTRSVGADFVPLGDQVNDAFKESAGNSSTTPTTPISPNTAPINPSPEVKPPSQTVPEDTGF
ncbi:MAG: COP23 domain-containing protein [Cyanobacteriota bacterium]|nr:COP23 domain-containing protein [Cyanobacteriota bacterium]